LSIPDQTIGLDDTSDDPSLGLAQQPCPKLIEAALTLYDEFWDSSECAEIEQWVDATILHGEMGLFSGESTANKTPHRDKYFFGSGYTYGYGKRGHEELLANGAVDPIPDWMRHLLVEKVEKMGVVPKGWLDSVVMNDYRLGSSIVAHVDPPQLFARPILTATFFGSARLVFGASFDTARRTPPAYSQVLTRGCMLALDGYAANRVTHGIRPEDLLDPRRVSLVLRHVAPEAPRAAPVAHTKAEVLVRKLQGIWRDVPGWGGRVYLVHDWTVYVFMKRQRRPSRKAASRQQQDLQAAHEFAKEAANVQVATSWALAFAEGRDAANCSSALPLHAHPAGGVSLVGGVLDSSLIFSEALWWYTPGCGTNGEAIATAGWLRLYGSSVGAKHEGSV
jgi:alkylated DNA repair protein alkB family protein 5